MKARAVITWFVVCLSVTPVIRSGIGPLFLLPFKSRIMCRMAKDATADLDLDSDSLCATSSSPRSSLPWDH